MKYNKDKLNIILSNYEYNTTGNITDISHIKQYGNILQYTATAKNVGRTRTLTMYRVNTIAENTL